MMLRILLLIADHHLSAALAAAIAGCGSAHAADADDPAEIEATLRGADWDVCIADTAYAADALAARRGRGVVLLGAGDPAVTAPRDRTRGAAAAHLLTIPCSVATLRDAVWSAAATRGPRLGAS